MKTLFFTIMGFFAAFTCTFGQGTPANLPTDISGTSQTVSATSTKNYILTYSYLNPFSNHPASLKTGDADPGIQYFNGLGDPEETVLVKFTQLGNDLVSYQTYDNFRRPEISYLPYGKGSNSGAYVSKTSFTSEQNTFLSGIYGSTDGSKGYSQTDYEESPLNRILKQGAPGNDWQINTHPVNFNYNTNLSTETVQTWKYTGESYSSYNYPSGRLYVKTTTDEDGKVVKEYIDYAGNLIQREMNGAKTRYCYDEFGRLKCIVQPEGSSPASTDNRFYYIYDERSRLTDRTIPAKGVEYYIYDSHDRVVLTQDGVQRGKQVPEWSYTRYDNLNRPVEQGTWATTTPRTSLKIYIDSNLDYMAGVSGRVILKYLYYNNYTGKPSYGSDITSLGISLATNNTGRLTWIKTKALDYESGMDYWLEQTIYYDRYGRVVQEVQDNHLNGVDYITNVYDFTGQIIQTRYRHTADGTTTYTDQYNDYDHRGRVIKVRNRINGANEVLLAGSNYNESDELVDKYLHSVSGGTFLQRNDYLYNIRGWLTEINSPTTFSENDQFGLKLYYNSAPTGGTVRYNGNISGMGWGAVANSNMLYRFSYDDNNRLSSADFYKSGIATNGFDANYTYDKNGNIKTLNRYSTAGSYIDQLTYQYSGNKITGLKDDSGDIANTVDYPGSTSSLSFNYDNNGNVTGEPHKQITLDYNLINLPREINLNGQNKYIYYYYTFDGVKLRKTVENNGVITKTDYCGPFVYETVSGTRSLKYLITPEGRAVKNGANWDYEYNLTDHLGNVRVVIHKGTNGSAEVIQERHYYPFGMEMNSLSTGSSSNKYLYNSKEHENDFDLDWYDYGARFYDPELGRFHTIDPLAGKYNFQSPYTYAVNNPIRFADFMGMGPDSTGTTYNDANIFKKAFANLVLGIASLGNATNKSNGNDNSSLEQDVEAGVGKINEITLMLIMHGEMVKSSTSGISGADDAVSSTSDDIARVASVADDLENAAKGMPNITKLTKAGNYPSWSTVKTRYWKVMNGGKVPTGTAKVRMRATGEIKNIKVSKELHHINGRTGADPHRFNNLKEVWPWEHQAIDPSRHTGYDFIQWVN